MSRYVTEALYRGKQRHCCITKHSDTYNDFNLINNGLLTINDSY